MARLLTKTSGASATVCPPPSLDPARPTTLRATERFRLHRSRVSGTSENESPLAGYPLIFSTRRNRYHPPFSPLKYSTELSSPRPSDPPFRTGRVSGPGVGFARFRRTRRLLPEPVFCADIFDFVELLGITVSRPSGDTQPAVYRLPPHRVLRLDLVSLVYRLSSPNRAHLGPFLPRPPPKIGVRTLQQQWIPVVSSVRPV